MSGFVHNEEAIKLLSAMSRLKHGDAFKMADLPKTYIREITEDEFRSLLSPDRDEWTPVLKFWPWNESATVVPVEAEEGEEASLKAYCFWVGIVVLEKKYTSTHTQYFLMSPYDYNCKEHSFNELEEKDYFPGVPKANPRRGYHVYVCSKCGYWWDRDSSD